MNMKQQQLGRSSGCQISCHLNALPWRLASLPVYEVGRGWGTGRDLGVGVGLGLGVGVGADCAQYLPPVLKLVVSSVPPQTIISLPVHTDA